MAENIKRYKCTFVRHFAPVLGFIFFSIPRFLDAFLSWSPKLWYIEFWISIQNWFERDYLCFGASSIGSPDENGFFDGFASRVHPSFQSISSKIFRQNVLHCTFVDFPLIYIGFHELFHPCSVWTLFIADLSKICISYDTVSVLKATQPNVLLNRWLFVEIFVRSGMNGNPSEQAPKWLSLYPSLKLGPEDGAECVIRSCEGLCGNHVDYVGSCEKMRCKVYKKAAVGIHAGRKLAILAWAAAPKQPKTPNLAQNSPIKAQHESSKSNVNEINL